MKKSKFYTKKLLTLLLALVMFVSIAPTNIFTVTASAVSGNEIVAYASKFDGYPYVYGTAGPNTFDCSGFVKYVFGNFGIYLPHGTSYLWNNPNDYGTIMGYNSTANAKPGDIISWPGHVGIYTGDGYCINALNDTAGVCYIKVSSFCDENKNPVDYRVLRIYGVSNATSKPTNLKISANNTSIAVGDSVIFTFESTNAEKHWMGIHKSDDNLCYEGAVDKTFTYTFEEEGMYYVDFDAINSYGSTRSEKLYIKVYKDAPGDCSVTVEKEAYAKGSKVKFNILANNYDTCWIGIHNQKGLYHSEPLTDKTFECIIDEAGEYYVNIEIKNPLGEKLSENAYFLVYDFAPVDCEISVAEDAVDVGEEIKFNLYSKYANSHWIGIHKEDGTLVHTESGLGSTFSYTFNEPGRYYADFDASNDFGKTRSEKVWFTVGKYNVKFNSNGGSNAPATQTKKYGESIAISSTEPTRDGYKFLGWSTDENATEPDYLPGDTYSENKDVTLYAVWEEVINEFTFTGEIETFGSSDDEITFDFIKVGETEVCHSTTVDGDSLTYEFFGIEKGEYTMRVSKNNHVAREYEVVVGTEDIKVDIKLNLIGDVNGDGKITLVDYTQVLKHVKKTSALDGYTFECADVNGDGKITLIDYTKILKHVKKTENLW